MTMKQTFVGNLKPGSVVDDLFLVRTVVERRGRRGDTYLVLTLVDRTGHVRAFADPPRDPLAAGDVVRVTGRIRVRQGDLELLSWDLTPVDRLCCDPGDLIPAAPEEPAAYLARLADCVARIGTRVYRNLIWALLDDQEFLEAFCVAPASLDHHHAYRGGLLQHTVEVMEFAYRLAGGHPRLAADLDLLLTTGFFHDLGKADTYTRQYPYRLTLPGRTLGHELLGLRRLFRALDVVPPDPGGAVGRLVAVLVTSCRPGAASEMAVTGLAAVLSALDRMSAASDGAK